MFSNGQYEAAIEICLDLLELDFQNEKAHCLLLSIFNQNGFKSQTVLNAREKLKQIMLN